MKYIYDITKFTMLDYEDHLACIIWFSKCNMRCNYCYNPNIVNSTTGNYTQEELLAFLDSRKNNLEAVVLSGGECTLFPHLKSLCIKIKAMGYKIKLDTNGSRPAVIKELLDENLINFVALDFKTTELKYPHLTGLENGFTLFKESLQLLLSSNIKFEVRTTLHGDLICEENINEMSHFLVNNGYSHTYYLQKFLDTGDNLGNLTTAKKSFDRNKLLNLLDIKFRNF